jgi:hypothetical protein
VAIDEKAIDLSVVIRRLSAKALDTMAHLMDNGGENVRAKVAADILDRNPETTKTHKVQLDSFSLAGADIARLSSAMVESAKIRAEQPLPAGDSVRLPASHQLHSGNTDAS